MLQQNDLQEIQHTMWRAINDATGIILSMHRSPDGDTAGAALALAHVLDDLGKSHAVFCVDPLPPHLGFLPRSRHVTNDARVWNPVHYPTDLLITLDSGDLSYNSAGAFMEKRKEDLRILNIDHHATNTQYGHHNFVLPNASSTCEIVYYFLRDRHPISKDIATCLLTGIVTDTGGFTNLATSATALDAAAALCARGASLSRIAKTTLHQHQTATLKLWGRAFSRLTKTDDNIAVTGITRRDITECGASDDATEGISNFLNSIDEQTDAHAVLVLTEQKNGTVKGSLRTRHPLMDVTKIATLYGGGGHKKAAGFTVPGRLTIEDGQWRIVPLRTFSQP